MRIYHDRLINNEDKELFINECVTLGNTFLPLAKDAPAPEEAEGDEKPPESARSNSFERKRIVFADFMQGRDG